MVGVGQFFWLKTLLEVCDYCIQYEGMCLSSLAKKAEQTDRWTDVQTDTFETLIQLKLREGVLTFIGKIFTKIIQITKNKN